MSSEDLAALARRVLEADSEIKDARWAAYPWHDPLFRTAAPALAQALLEAQERIEALERDLHIVGDERDAAERLAQEQVRALREVARLVVKMVDDEWPSYPKRLDEMGAEELAVASVASEIGGRLVFLAQEALAALAAHRAGPWAARSPLEPAPRIDDVYIEAANRHDGQET